MSTAITQKRRRRVERRAIPEIVEAVHSGKLSVNLADQWLHLSKRKQAAELERKLNEAAERAEKHRLVASVIRNYLNELGEKRVDLVELSGKIKEALGFAKSI